MWNKDETSNSIEDWRVIVTDDCIWCWACVAIYSDGFDLDDEWKAKFIWEDLDEKSIKDAIWVCPVEAIKRNDN